MIVNSGTVTGSKGIAFGNGHNETIIDSGTIDATSGNALYFGNGNDLLQLQSGNLAFQGVVNGNQGTNTLEFTSGASTGTLTGSQADFIDFGNGTVDTGASWVFAGTNTIGANTTLTNSGTLTNDGTLTLIGEIAGGSFSNLGSISGVVTLTAGAYFHNAGEINTTGPVAVEATGRATIVNSGTIDPSGPGVYLAAGGVLTNAAGGYIGGGSYGVKINGSASATVTNFGTLSGTQGVYVAGAGTANQTLIDSGTLIGTGGTAVAFGAGTNLLVDDPGAVFIGSVVAAGTTTLELASAASAGTIAGLGSTITNFDSLVFDSGGRWTVKGNDSASGLGGLGITGFTVGDTIDLTGFVAVSETFANNALVLTDGGGAYDTLAIQGSFVSGNFHLADDDAGGTDITFQTPPVISGTVAGQTTTDEAIVTPFVAVSITDPNVSQTETITITLSHGGTATDADGTLSGSGLSKTGTGTYTLVASSAAAATTELQGWCSRRPRTRWRRAVPSPPPSPSRRPTPPAPPPATTPPR